MATRRPSPPPESSAKWMFSPLHDQLFDLLYRRLPGRAAMRLSADFGREADGAASAEVLSERFSRYFGEYTLWHYTGAIAFTGMFADSERLGDLQGHRVLPFWATHPAHLNDKLELSWFLHGCVTRLRDWPHGEVHQLASLIANRLEGAIGTQQGHSYFISLTSSADDLPQWRAYGDAGSGVALGFKLSELWRLTHEVSPLARIFPVQYGDVDMGPLLEEILLIVASHRPERVRRGTAGFSASKLTELQTEWFMRDVEEAFMSFAAFCKHPGFSTEREWRIAVPRPRTLSTCGGIIPDSFEGERLRFSAAGPVPYVYGFIPLAAITEVMLGPRTDARRAEAAMRSILDRHGLAEVKVSRSAIPLR